MLKLGQRSLAEDKLANSRKILGWTLKSVVSHVIQNNIYLPGSIQCVYINYKLACLLKMLLSVNTVFTLYSHTLCTGLATSTLSSHAKQRDRIYTSTFVHCTSYGNLNLTLHILY